MANRNLQMKMRRDAERSRGPMRVADYRRIPITSAEQLVMLRQFGWREASLYQVTDELRSQLAWFVYANGSKRINVLTRN